MVNDKDRRLREKQRAAELEEDRLWDAAHGARFEQLVAWNLHEMETDFARAMLTDGLAQEEIVSLLLSMRHHHDPLYVGYSEGEIAEVQSTVEVAWADFTGLLDQFRDEDEMIWDLRDCFAIRARLAAEDLAGAYDEDTVARIERATGRPFIPDSVGDSSGVFS